MTTDTPDAGCPECDRTKCLCSELKDGSLRFFWNSDFWGYKWIGHCYYIESRDGEMLFGDRLSDRIPETRQYCRAANIAHRVASERAKAVFTKIFKELP